MTPRSRWLDDHPDDQFDTPPDPDRESIDDLELRGAYDDVIYGKEDDHADNS